MLAELEEQNTTYLKPSSSSLHGADFRWPPRGQSSMAAAGTAAPHLVGAACRPGGAHGSHAPRFVSLGQGHASACVRPDWHTLPPCCSRRLSCLRCHSTLLPLFRGHGTHHLLSGLATGQPHLMGMNEHQLMHRPPTGLQCEVP